MISFVGGQHTPGSGEAASGEPVVERKVKPDGTVREYECSLLYRDDGLAVIRFVAPAGVSFNSPLQPGPRLVSDGYFWRSRPYNAYRMKNGEGAIIAHRFDAVADVSFEAGAVVYRDLFLDWWAMPDGSIREEDREEFDSAVAAGTVTAADRETAGLAAQQVLSRYRHIIDELEALERTLGLAI
jgi:hypothetical protein